MKQLQCQQSFSQVISLHFFFFHFFFFVSVLLVLFCDVWLLFLIRFFDFHDYIISYCLCPSRRRYGTKCGGCAQGISPSDLVRKARSKVFHLNCFTCIMCNKQLSTGEELYILDEYKFVCKEDYMNNNIGKDTNLLSGE